VLCIINEKKLTMSTGLQNWILNEISNRNILDRSQPDSVIKSALMSPTSQTNSGSGSLFSAEFDIVELRNEPVVSLLSQVYDLNFPIFDFLEQTKGYPLTVLGHHLTIETGLLARLNLNPTKFLNFLRKVEASYDSTLSCKDLMILEQSNITNIFLF
jgi:hypothetical protein